MQRARQTIRVGAVWGIVALGALASVAAGQILNEDFKLLASDGAAGDRFGWSVSVSGNTAVIGAKWDDDNGDSSGSAYVFVRDGDAWTQQAKLLPSDGAGFDRFGDSVSIHGDTAVISAPEDNDNGTDSGSAYVFVRDSSSWTQHTKLLPSDGGGNEYFGSSVSVDNDTIVIGAELHDWIGSAYVFVRDGGVWTQQAKLLPSDGAYADYFGISVAVNGDTAVIGADWDDDNGDKSGSAYVFVRDGSTWTQQAKLLPSDGFRSAYFGYSVAISGDTAVIGAYQDAHNNSSGAAYVFVRDGGTWIEQATLRPDDSGYGDYFGFDVSINGDTAVVGSYRHDDNGTNSGATYVYVRDNGVWTKQAKLLPSDGAEDDSFGVAVSVSGNTAVVGALEDDDNGSFSGSAYVFDLCPADFNGDGSVNGPDFLAFLNAFVAGDPSADFNSDGTVNSQDFVAFLNAFVAGC